MRSTTQAMRNRHVPNPRSQQCHKTRPVKTLSPIVRNIVMTDGIRNHLSCQPTSANALGPCRKSHACHANEEVSDGLAPATQNNVSDLKSVLDAPRVP